MRIIRSITMAVVATATVFALAGVGTAGAAVNTEIHFQPGTNGTTVGNSVIRGEADTYLVDAYAGQLMGLQISSVEDNAVFHVYSPSGDALSFEESASTIILPESGKYSIVVSGTRGNATYDLHVWIV